MGSNVPICSLLTPRMHLLSPSRHPPYESTMPAFADIFSRPAKWTMTALAAAVFAVFAVLDVIDVLLCLLYAVLDGFLEETPVGCYCDKAAATGEEDDGLSETLYVRRSACRDALLRLLGAVIGCTRRKSASPANARSPRWSDCGCGTCRAWRSTGGDRLHFVLQEPAAPEGAEAAQCESDREEDAIFIHGFSSSSSFWAQTVFPELAAGNHRRLFAVDLLGFGDSPKPANCAYKLQDHVEAIERSLIDPLQLTSFHLVSHSMGCIVAIALAAKHPARVKSITLVAPPYVQPCEETASQVALRRFAEKKLWPPSQFSSAVMSWYEHIGRTVCFIVCKNHRFWEWLIKKLTRTSSVNFLVRDLTKHTHHSAWHTMHNVICGGAMAQDLEMLAAAGVPVRVVHGDGDQVVPVECSSRHLKSKLPRAELRVVGGRDHRTVVFGREEEFAAELRAFWSGCGVSFSQA